MKKIAFITIVFMFALSASSQKLVKGSLLTLKGAEKVQLVVDFSNVYIHGMSEEEFAEYEKNWKVDKPQVTSIFMSAVREAVGDVLKIGRYPDATFVMKVNVIDISTTGDFECEVEINDSSSNKVATIDLLGKGGRFGTKLNLIKDGAKHTGEALGTFIKKELDEKKKKR